MDGTRGHHAKSYLERHILYDLTYMWTLKKVKLVKTETRMAVTRDREVGDKVRCCVKAETCN